MLEQKNIFNYYGHETVEKDLVEALKQNKLPHGFLLVGPPGIGKATLAVRFASFLLSGARTEKIDLDPTDPVIRRILVGSHGDFKYIKPQEDQAAKEISIHQIRSVTHFLSQTPLEAGWRVVIIDGALNRQASNALLKILEEPPRQTLIILIMSQMHQILPTIRSRCRVIALRELSDETLKRILKSQNISDFPPELFPLCNGSIGRALQLYQADALRLVKDINQALLQAQDYPERLYSFCKMYSAKPKKDDAIDKLPLVLEILTHLVFQQSIGKIQNLPFKKQAHEWASTWQNLQKIQNELRLRHLDRMQSLLTAFKSVITL